MSVHYFSIAPVYVTLEACEQTYFAKVTLARKLARSCNWRLLLNCWELVRLHTTDSHKMKNSLINKLTNNEIKITVEAV